MKLIMSVENMKYLRRSFCQMTVIRVRSIWHFGSVLLTFRVLWVPSIFILIPVDRVCPVGPRYIFSLSWARSVLMKAGSCLLCWVWCFVYSWSTCLSCWGGECQWPRNSLCVQEQWNPVTGELCFSLSIPWLSEGASNLGSFSPAKAFVSGCVHFSWTLFS